MNTIPMLITVSVVAAGCAAARAADLPSHRLPAARRGAGHLVPAIVAFIQAAEQKVDALHSFMLVRHGSVWRRVVVAVRRGGAARALLPEQELHFHGSRARRVRGRISLDDPVLGFFPDKAPPEPARTSRPCGSRPPADVNGQTEDAVKDFPFQSRRTW